MQYILPRRGLYAVTDTANLSQQQVLDTTGLILEGGVNLVQYRNKSTRHDAYTDLGYKLVQLCERYRVPLIVNDDPQLAREVGAAGVHLGREDADIGEVKRDYPALIIGVSCYNDLERAGNAVKSGADYVAFGSFFASPSKPETVRAPLELLEQACDCIDVPIVAIGGITPDNAQRLVSAGADFLAVISGLYGHPDPYHQARRYLQSFTN